MAAMRILCVFLELNKSSNHELTTDVNFDRVTYYVHMKILCGNIICFKYRVGVNYAPVACVSTTETCSKI